MGEVYRARDTRLDRTVAIKVLPASHAADVEFRNRFEREARAIAALNHPHICTVHDVGRHDATDYLVMELVDGETLATKLEKGPLPLDDALRYAVQIADALSQAHRAGIVHRDLKPANVMVTKTGVKLLDFGLAKSTVATLAGQGLSALPTTPANVTMQGTMLGTLQYMAPEQVEGGEADARSDIFAFGAVLYEMITGQRAFAGKSPASLIGSILRDQPPPISIRQPLAPRALDRIVATCLAKDPDERWQTARDLVRELRWLADPANRDLATATAAATGARRARAWLVVAALMIATLILGGVLGRTTARPVPPSGAITRWAMTSDERPTAARVQISRDGRRVVHFGESTDATPRLYVRPFDQLDPVVIRGTERAITFALSPDATSVAFVVDGQLKRVPIAGGPPVVICPVPTAGIGLDWGAGDVIVFGARDGLYRVPASGGSPARITTLDTSRQETGHGHPAVLSDGATVLFATRQGTTEEVAWVPLAGGPHSTLLPGGVPRVTATGLLLFRRGSTLFGVRFDTGRKQVVGEPVPLLGEVTSLLNGYMAYDVSDDGTLIFRPRRAELQQVSWVTRDGRTSVAVAEQFEGVYHGPPALSPDGRRLAVTTHPTNGEDQIVVYDLERGIRTPLGAAQALVSRYPVWTRDGRHLTFSSTRDGTWDIFEVPAASLAQPPQRLVGRPGSQWPASWSPSSEVLMFTSGGPAPPDLWMYRREGGTSAPLLETPEGEGPAVFSPDGRWLAYDSDLSGRDEVYIRPASGQGEPIQVSTGGGRHPVWRGDGQEIFYATASEAIMAVAVRFTLAPVLAAPTELFRVRLFNDNSRPYTVTEDGQRFVVLQDLATTPASIIVVQNWFRELDEKIGQ
jgi:serine/threonine-protein kinase